MAHQKIGVNVLNRVKNDLIELATVNLFHLKLKVVK